VTINYEGTRTGVPGLRKVNSTVILQDGESQDMGGLVDNENNRVCVISVKISDE
jgi:hypothetical protein